MAVLAHNDLLLSLKDLRQCDESLTLLVKRTILAPFQPDLQRRDSERQHKDKRQEATRLSPLAMSIVNQNIQSLKSFKEWVRNNINNEIDTGLRTKRGNSIKGCLFDTSFDAIGALKLMNVYLPLKPLDIEKTTSNLICKLVDLCEWTRALDELVKLRQDLANLGMVILDNDLPLNLANISTKHTCKGDQDRDDNNRNEESVYGSCSDEIPFLYDKDLTTRPSHSQQSLNPLDHSSLAQSASSLNLFAVDCCCCHPFSLSPWEESMIHKYSDLFTFPLDANMNERGTILLVLAYQMNAIRSLCGINGGSMIKYLVILMDQPGNFIDWCKRLIPFDNLMAKKQLDLFQRHMMKTADKASKVNDDSLMVTAIQALALRSTACSNMVPLQSICDRFVSFGSNYEKSTTKVKYNHLETFCSDMMQTLHPLSQHPSDLEAYFGLCEYHAYVSRKAKIYSGVLSSYISMIKLLDDIFNEMTTTPTCYYAAFDALVKLSLCTLQMDAMILGKSYVDLQTLLSDTNSSIDALIQVIQIDDIYNNERTEWVLEKLVKIIRGFWQCSNRFLEMVQQQDNAKTLNRHSTLQSPASPVSSFEMEWQHCLQGISKTLQGCHELLRLKMLLMRKLEQSGSETTSTLPFPTILLTYVHIMIVLARIQFDARNNDAYHQSFEYLDTAERLCSDYGFSPGYRGISAAYYSFGTEMVKMNFLSKAVYPLRKACSILELNSGVPAVDADRLQLAKRYEALGICFQKNGDLKGTVKAYRMALKYIPAATIDLFTSDSDRLTISKLIEQQPLVPRLIDQFIRASFSDHERQTTYSTELMDLSTLSPIQKCILYECELRVFLTLSPRFNLAAQQGWIINFLLQHYPAEEYPIRRSRTLLSKIRMMHTKGLADEESIRSAIQYALEAQKLLKTENFCLDDNLQSCYQHYQALTYFWLGILRREFDENALDLYSSALRHWNTLLEKVGPLSGIGSNLKEDLENVCQQIDDIDGLYNHLDILSDLLGLIGQPYLQINSLRLLLKLNNGLRELTADCYSDSIVITVNIGCVYTELGYSGKADVEFSKVEGILARYPCSNQAELHYLVQYSHYLSKIGQYDKSQATFNAARVLWDKNQQLDEPLLNTLGSTKQQAMKYLLISDCYLARSSISLYKESLDVAISDATSSYRVINNFVEYIKKPTGFNLDGRSTNSSKNNDFCTGQDLNQQLSTVSDLLFNEYQWITAMKLGACIERLAALHMTRGSWRDAQYYLLQGRQLGERVKSNAMVYRFLLLQSDSYLRTSQLEKSKSSIELAITIHAKGPTYLWEDAILTSASGNLYAHQNLLHEALESYDIVDKLLQRMMDPTYIADLETLPESDDDYEQHPKHSRDANVVKEDLKVTQYTCQILQAKQDENTIRRLLVMARIGLMSSGLQILEKIEQSSHTASNLNLLKATRVHIRLMVTKNELMDHTNLTYMENSVLASTSVLSFSRGSGFTGTSHNIHMICESLDQLLSWILDTIKKCARIETVALVEQLYRDAASTMFLKNQVSITDNNHASLASYYLEMAKYIGIRREMLSCLDRKLLISPSTTTNGLTWPKQVTNLASTGASNDNNNINNIRPPPSALLSELTTAHLTNLRKLYQQEYDLNGPEFQSEFVDILPSHWTVCSLSLNVDDQALYATQYRTGEPPLVLRLPLTRAGKLRQSKYSDRGKVGISYQQVISEFKSIMDLHNETMHPNKTTFLEKDVEGWWMDRSRLDARLKRLLEETESSWIGGFKGLFTGRYPVSIKAFDIFRKQLTHTLMTNVNGLSTPNNKGFMDINEPILRMIIQLGIHPTDHELEDVVYFLLACLENHAVCVDYSDITIDRMIQQIRQIIRSYHDQAAQDGINTMERLPNEHIILIPDKHTQFLPLESLPTLRSQSVSRLPCLSFLRDRILYTQQNSTGVKNRQECQVVGSAWEDSSITIDGSKSYYILDPNNNLDDTRSKFEHVLGRMNSWEGCIGKEPSETECRSMLMEKDLYMYFGPGAGQSFIRGETIRQLPKCAVVLLMGCNNGGRTSNSKDDNNQRGYYLDYLLAGSLAVVTNLWNTTDKSIHQTSQRIMDQWGLINDTTWDGFMHQRRTKATLSLAEALASSRDECQFPYLVGASFVVYGVPVYVV